MRNTRLSVASDRLLTLAQSGDREAFEILLARSRRVLTRLAANQVYRRLQGKADAADIVQETLLEMHRQFGQFRGRTEAEFAAWMRRIFAGLVANHVRRFLGTKQRDVRLETPLVVELNNAAAMLAREGVQQGTPSEQAERREEETLLADAVKSLPSHYRRVVRLRNLEGLPFSVIAARMDRSVNSVEKLWVRALALLRQELAEKL